MKKYLMMLSALAFIACNDSKKAEEQARETANHENEILQRTIDSMAVVNSETNHSDVNHSSSNSSSSTSGNSAADNNSSAAPAKKKGMSSTTKGALIGTGVGIVGGAVTGAAVSKDKGKGAVVGGIIGGAVGSGVGYGAGAKKDHKDTTK